MKIFVNAFYLCIRIIFMVQSARKTKQSSYLPFLFPPTCHHNCSCYSGPFFICLRVWPQPSSELTERFATLEPQNQEIVVFCVVHKHWLRLKKGEMFSRELTAKRHNTATYVRNKLKQKFKKHICMLSSNTAYNPDRPFQQRCIFFTFFSVRGKALS